MKNILIVLGTRPEAIKLARVNGKWRCSPLLSNAERLFNPGPGAAPSPSARSGNAFLRTSAGAVRRRTGRAVSRSCRPAFQRPSAEDSLPPLRALPDAARIPREPEWRPRPRRRRVRRAGIVPAGLHGHF